jgi:hypothetical protein
MLSYDLILACVAAGFFYQAGKQQTERLGWFALSIAVSCAIMLVGGGFLILVLGQVGLFAGITIFRTINDKTQGG